MHHQIPRAQVSDLLRADLPDAACHEIRCIQRALNIVHAHLDNLRDMGLNVTPFSGGPHGKPACLGVKVAEHQGLEVEIYPYL